MEVSGQLHTQEKSLQYPFYRRLGEPQSQYGYYVEEKALLPIRNQTLVVQPVSHRYTN
jgi:hypothetical protein